MGWGLFSQRILFFSLWLNRPIKLAVFWTTFPKICHITCLKQFLGWNVFLLGCYTTKFEVAMIFFFGNLKLVLQFFPHFCFMSWLFYFKYQCSFVRRTFWGVKHQYWSINKDFRAFFHFLRLAPVTWSAADKSLISRSYDGHIFCFWKLFWVI